MVDPVAHADNPDAMVCPVDSSPGTYMSEGTTATVATPGTDPSYFQAAIGYNFGNSTIAASWYSSEDFMDKGSEGTAIGIGVNHNLPKVGAQVYAAVQNYDVTKSEGAKSMDETVLVVGTRVKF